MLGIIRPMTDSRLPLTHVSSLILQIDSQEPHKGQNVAVISQEDFAKIRPAAMVPNPSKPPPPPPINTPCVNAGSLMHHNQNDLDQLDFTFGEDDDDEHNKSTLSRWA